MASPLSSSTLQSLIGAVADLYSVGGVESFSTRAIRSSNAIVQGDITVYTEIDPIAGRVEFAADQGHAALASVQADFLRLQHQHPGIKRQMAEGTFGVHAVSRLVSNREWKTLDIYNEVFRKMEVEDQVVVSAPMPAPTALGITVSRSRRGFKDSELAALEIYAKHFTHAYRIEQRFMDQTWLADSLDSSRDTRIGFVLASCDGQIQVACQRAEAFLTSYFPVKGAKTRLLPALLIERIASLSSVEESRLMVSPLMGITREQHELSVTFRRDNRLDRWVLRMEEETPGMRSRAKASSLSPRLSSVLTLLLKGLAEKEIASQLSLAKTTIHDYVKQIYQRFGVHSRSELMALWIHE